MFSTDKKIYYNINIICFKKTELDKKNPLKLYITKR